MLPPSLIQSLNGTKGFDKEAFEKVHDSGGQITSVRLNPAKPVEIQNSKFKIHNPIPWCIHGYYLKERPFFTFDPVFHAGAYYVQEASSMFLWEVLKQIIGKSSQQKVLDLCAAPGGKTTLLASYFNDGWIVANEVIRSRANILVENITKWGSDHVIVTNNDPAHFQSLPGYFDVMVIDAPCSGSGLFRRDPAAVDEWSEDNVQLCSRRQQRILADVLPALKEGGILIYSTCSYSKEEDEDILDWIMQHVEMNSLPLQVASDWNIIESQSDKYQAYGYRFYPDKIKGEGFFIAVFQKRKRGDEARCKEQQLATPTKQELQHIQSFISLPGGYVIFKQGDSFSAIKGIFLTGLKQLAKQLYIKKAGVELGSIKGEDFIPSHELAVSTLPLKNMAAIEFDELMALQYLRKKEVTGEAVKGWNLVKYCGLPLGWIKVLPNRINNYYPAEWRILKD